MSHSKASQVETYTRSIRPVFVVALLDAFVWSIPNGEATARRHLDDVVHIDLHSLADQINRDEERDASKS